jgi:hypothetical protein
MMMDKMGAKKKAIEELMCYLDQKDGDELGSAMKPKEAEIEVTKVEGMGEPEAEAVVAEEGTEPKMSDEELEELIQAIQSKLG